MSYIINSTQNKYLRILQTDGRFLKSQKIGEDFLKIALGIHMGYFVLRYNLTARIATRIATGNAVSDSGIATFGPQEIVQ